MPAHLFIHKQNKKCYHYSENNPVTSGALDLKEEAYGTAICMSKLRISTDWKIYIFPERKDANFYFGPIS